MAFTDLVFDPATGLNDISEFSTTPSSESETRQYLQEMPDQIQAHINNVLNPELESVTTGTSGGEKIGTKAISGVTGTTVAAQLSNLKTQIDGVSQGAVADGSITTAKLAPDAVTGAKLADESVDSEHYVDGSIDTAHLSIDSINGTVIADNSIDSEHYVDGSIDTAHLSASSVTEAKLETGAVTETKIAANVITAAKIATNAVTEAKLEAGAITYIKLDSTLRPAFSGYNIAINGNFKINQRAKTGSVVLSAGEYGHDRFKAGAGGCSYTFASYNGFTVLTISAGSLIQVVEGLDFQTGAHTLSWSGTAQGNLDGNGATTSPTTQSITGGINIDLEFGVGTLSNVKLEKGSVATDFIPRLYAEELMLCQRFYCKSYTINVAPGSNSAEGQIIESATRNNASETIGTRFPVSMRVSPAVTIYAPINGTADRCLNNGDKVASALNVGTTGFSLVSITSGVTSSPAKYHYVANAEL